MGIRLLTYSRLFLMKTLHLLVVLVQSIENVLRPRLELGLCNIGSFAMFHTLDR